VSDLAERGAHPGGEHERARFPGDHRRAGEQDIGARGQVRLVARVRILEHRDRFASDGGAVHLHPERYDQTAVGRNGLALVQADHVARHELAARQLDQGAVAFRGGGQRRRFDPFDLVRTKFSEPAPRLCLADARRPAMQAGEGVFDAELVNPHPDILQTTP
jgi:hypothetical protein